MWFVINPNTRELIKRSETYFNRDESVLPTDGNLWLKRVGDTTQPAYDPATQKLVRTSTDDDAARTRTFALEVVPLTQAELDARTQAEADETERQQLKAAYDDLRNGVGTAAQRLTRIEKAVAWILRNEAR